MGTSWSNEANDTSQQSPTQAKPLTPKNDAKLVHSNSNNNNLHNKPNEATKLLPKLPHNFEAIIKDSDRAIDKSSIEQLYQQLHAGVYLNGKKKKYWVEKKGNINCFMMFANDLSITWADNTNYWNLHNVETSEDGNITIAQLKNVCWLEVHGKINTTKLSPGITYQVSYIIKLENTSYGWEVPIKLRLTLPNGTKQEHQECLKEKPKEEWVPIRVGEFVASSENVGDVQFSLFEYEGGNWKKGLVIKGANIEPKI
ncbi:hypothetical protein RND81_10G014700 [Saponaria officinalis]|uniref:Uncharacterized protein n=1 Tax=Saponaria officinalis TaxID=3572 RepID=A0AAW1HZ95_SAPOF